MPERGKLQRVTMEYVRKDDTVVCRTLRGEAAQEWDRALDGLVLFADSHRVNPDWSKFKWEERISKRK